MIHDLRSGNVTAAPSTKTAARECWVLNQPIRAIRVNEETVLRSSGKSKVIGKFDCQLTVIGTRHSSIPAEGQKAGSGWIVGDTEVRGLPKHWTITSVLVIIRAQCGRNFICLLSGRTPHREPKSCCIFVDLI